MEEGSVKGKAGEGTLVWLSDKTLLRVMGTIKYLLLFLAMLEINKPVININNRQLKSLMKVLRPYDWTVEAST